MGAHASVLSGVVMGILGSLAALPACFVTDDKVRRLLDEHATGDTAAEGGGDTDIDAVVDIEIDFVTVPAQTFDMGCTPGQSNCQSNESPVMPVTLTHDYLVSRTEITQAQFEAAMGYNPAGFPDCGPDCPVEMVSWYEAAAFANAVSTAAGLAACYDCSGSGDTVVCGESADPYTCTGYRLLTEAEWEGAARCSEDTLYAGSDDVAAVAWTSESADLVPHPVASLDSNGCGLKDMSGNVWEWTAGWYGQDYYRIVRRTDPTGPDFGSYRVSRGGGWASEQGFARVAFRNEDLPIVQSNSLGLRLARSLP